MKHIITLIAGASLRTVAAPLVVTGLATQSVASGLIKTGVAIHNVGQTAELKGLKYHEAGSRKIGVARTELTKDRATRRAERVALNERKKAEATQLRQQRIAGLEAQAFARRQAAEMTVAMNAAIKQSRRESRTFEAEVVTA